MQESGFNENVDYLYRVQAELEAIEQLKKELASCKNQQKSIKKAITSEEKSIQDEISQTIRKRKAEIEKVYDEQIEANKAQSKAVWARRDRLKSKRVGERVSYETADLAEENRQLQVEMRTLFRAQRVPSYCRSNLFYALFMTKRFWEMLVLLVAIAIFYIGLPMLTYFLCTKVFLKSSKDVTLICTLMVALVLFVVNAVYCSITNKVKLRHYEILKEGRNIKDQMEANKRHMKAIRNKINKDKDESKYGLDEFDNRLLELEDEMKAISQEKKAAMIQFENETRQILEEEVNVRRMDRLEEMRTNAREAEEHMTALDEQIRNSTLAITNQYGSILGNEFCTLSKVADLISLMEDGSADTVSEAITAYKGAGR